MEDKIIKQLKDNNLLRIIDEPLDIYLEIPHIAYIEVKKENSKALLFTNPIDKKNNKTFDTPVLMNVFCNEKAVELFIGDGDKIAKEIQGLLKMKPPAGFMNKLAMFGQLFNLKSVFPKRLKGKGECQQIIKTGADVKLSDLPVLTTWEQDGGPFITMGQVYTTSLDGTMHNVGMYRLQIQAPLPIGVFELMLYGFVKKKNAQLVKSITNDIYVPSDVDFVIEGFVDVENMRIEGPFGDHTGYYTLEEEYPFLDVTAITSKKNPIFAATVVGKPLLEDKYMGHATERIFLPLLQTTAPDLLDYYMPENGVFHNLILGKIKTAYPGHAQQIMHAFWGVGQMSFVKHAIFVDQDAPELPSMEVIPHILNRFATENILITKGVVDALDHSSPKFAVGGKLGVDCTGNDIVDLGIEILEDEILLEKMQDISSDVKGLKQYYKDTKSPIVIISVEKNRSQKYLIEELKPLFNHIKILAIVDEKNNDLENAYMLI